MRYRKETISHFARNNLMREGKKYRYYFFDYLYYRLFVLYQKYNEPARFSACGVLCLISLIALFFFCIFLASVLPDYWIFTRKNFTPSQGAFIGRRCECIFTGLMVTGVIEDIQDDRHSTAVKVRFDHPHQWGDDLYNDVWAWGRKIDEFGTLHHLQLLEDKPDFQIMTVVFGEPISRIDRSVFEDVATWGVCSLQGWVNSYESVRFVAIDDHTAIITGEYNMEQVKVWLEKYTSIKSLKTS